jgi:hypothetical protein
MLLERDYPDFTLNLVEQGKSSPRYVERDFGNLSCYPVNREIRTVLLLHYKAPFYLYRYKLESLFY